MTVVDFAGVMHTQGQISTDKGAYFFSLDGKPLAHMVLPYELYPELMKDADDYSSVVRDVRNQHIGDAAEAQAGIKEYLDKIYTELKALK